MNEWMGMMLRCNSHTRVKLLLAWNIWSVKRTNEREEMMRIGREDVTPTQSLRKPQESAHWPLHRRMTKWWVANTFDNHSKNHFVTHAHYGWTTVCAHSKKSRGKKDDWKQTWVFQRAPQRDPSLGVRRMYSSVVTVEPAIVQKRSAARPPKGRDNEWRGWTLPSLDGWAITTTPTITNKILKTTHTSSLFIIAFWFWCCVVLLPRQQIS